MFTSERQNAILEILKENGSEVVKNLAKSLYVSEATVRRDLKEMQKMGLIERSHGGAILPETADEVSIFVRINKNAKEKERVATAALSVLPECKTLFIDSSSTALALASRMDLALKTVVTNNLQTAMLLAKKSNINLILLGGSVQYNTNSATGSFTVRQIGDFSFDLMLTSSAGIDGGEALDKSIEQREIKRAAFLRSKKKILLADHTKFGVSAPHKIAALTDYDFVVTDEAPSIGGLENVNLVYLTKSETRPRR